MTTHQEYAKRAKVAVPCAAWYVNFGGGCLNCGWLPAYETCRCGHPEGQHGPDGCTAPTRLVGDMTYAERPCYCETFSDCYEGRSDA